MILKIENNDTIRTWYDKDKIRHDENVLEFFIDGEKSHRGFCISEVKRLIPDLKLKIGEYATFKIERKS